MKDIFGYELKSLDMQETYCSGDWRNTTKGVHLRVDSKISDLDELLSQCKRDLIAKLFKDGYFKLVKLERCLNCPTISYIATFQINDTSISTSFVSDDSNLIEEANKALSETLLNNKY